MNFRALIFLILLAMMACEKEIEDDEPKGPISNTPYIELRNISPNDINQFESVTFSIFYRDGDGDIGFDSADSISLWITDERFPLTQGFHIPPLSPVDTAISIQGTFKVDLNNVILKNPDASDETVQFTVELKDRAGNSSNIVRSEAITVKSN